MKKYDRMQLRFEDMARASIDDWMFARVVISKWTSTDNWSVLEFVV